MLSELINFSLYLKIKYLTNMTKQVDLSEMTQHNMSFSLTSSPNMSNQTGSSEPNQKTKKRFFEVFHKKEIVYLNQDSISNDQKSTIPNIQYKCVYCGNKYSNMNRFEAHMRMHVRIFLLII